MDSTDVAIVGGGAVGSAVAYYLASDPSFKGSVVVVERDPTYARASTPLSCGGIRQQFSIRENVEIGLFAQAFIEQAAELLSVEGEQPDLGFIENGYLFLVGPNGRDILAENHALQLEAGADILWLEPEALAERFPYIRTEGIAAATFGTSGEGWLDPNTLLQALKRKARSLGVRYLTDEVSAIQRDKTRVARIALAGNGELRCGTCVIAAGANSGAVAGLAGIALPVGPRVRSVFKIDCRDPLPGPPLPLTITTSGTFLRPESSGYVCGISPPEEDDPESWELEVDWRWYEEVIWPDLAAHIPAFEAIKLTGAWAGPYDFNSFDHNGIVGPHPDIANLMFATGFSGHGLQQSPAVGRAIAELVVHGGYRSIDLSRFAIDRILADRPLKERNVV